MRGLLWRKCCQVQMKTCSTGLAVSFNILESRYVVLIFNDFVILRELELLLFFGGGPFVKLPSLLLLLIVILSVVVVVVVVVVVIAFFAYSSDVRGHQEVRLSTILGIRGYSC